MIDLLFKIQKCVNEEDVLAVKSLTGKRKKDKEIDLQNRKKDCKLNPLDSWTSKTSPKTIKKRLNFTPLLMPVHKILILIKDDATLKRPKPLSSRPKGRNSWKYCRFYEGYGHSTDECRELKGQSEELIQRGKLQEFIKKDYQPRQNTNGMSNDNQKEERDWWCKENQ